MYPYVTQTAFAAACAIVLVRGQAVNPGSKANTEEIEGEFKGDFLDDSHTFVALIDIVFMDNSKRTCTGAIIHENIVITAAHCFLGKDQYTSSKPELTASFVVIGTKKMFDTGYEQYLPIERIVVHPKYEGWTADLALVFTFAGMTSDKPGSIIQLAGEKSTAHLDSNLTVYSWGHPRKNPSTMGTFNEKKYQNFGKDDNNNASEESCDDSSEDGALRSQKNTRTSVPNKLRNYAETQSLRERKKKISRKNREIKYKSRLERAREGIRKEILNKQRSTISRYLTIVESPEILESSINPYVFGQSDSYESIEKLLRTRSLTKVTPKEPVKKNASTETSSSEDSSETEVTSKENKIKRYRKVPFSLKTDTQWRRSMGTQHNRLLVETFGFVNLHICKVIVDKGLPPLYNITKHNDVLCYTNDERCVNDNDSGAPAVRQGQLVAITLGGAECEGDNVAIGMKMACYCSWISDNLPRGSAALSCCKNCCDVKHTENKERRHRFINKYI